MKSFSKLLLSLLVLCAGIIFSGCGLDDDVSISGFYEPYPNKIVLNWDYGKDIEYVDIRWECKEGGSGSIYAKDYSDNTCFLNNVNKDATYTFYIQGYKKINGSYEKGGDDSCTVRTDATGEKTGSIPKYFWGTWIRMDTGTEYYFTSFACYDLSKYSKDIVTKDISIFTIIDGDNVISDGTYYYFRKGGKSRSFTANIAGIEGSPSYSRAAGLGMTKVTRRNKGNALDKELDLVPDTTGQVEFTKAVADDAQLVTVTTDTTSVTIETTPKYDGENIGSIPIVEKDSFGFKTTYEITNCDDQGFYYGNNYEDYYLRLNFTNIGDKTCSLSIYDVTTDDPKLDIRSYNGNKSGNFNSIQPGKSETITLKVSYGNLDEEFVDVPVDIRIEDGRYDSNKVWNDRITLRFYKGLVRIRINSRNFTESSYSYLKGFVIYPDGRSQRFSFRSNSTESFTIPWSESNYYLAFSGIDSPLDEIGYSFCFDEKASLANINTQFTKAEINAYEPNNSTKDAKIITDLTQPVKACLGPVDFDKIDFYIINNRSCEIE